MDRLRRWRSRWPAGRAGAWRAGLTALATAALALLLAVLFHLGVAAVAVAILGSLPTAYLGWRALTGAPGKPAYGRRAAQWTPVELGVHQVIGGGPMPAYIRRPHDELLRAVLDPAVAASRLVVVRGGSSTGKTRAAYEAVADRLADWRVDYPLDPGALTARLEAGIPDRTVLWLGELRQYADADGGAAVLGRLADLFQGEGRLVITTMWPEQWATYAAAARAGPGAADPAGTAGRLLEPLPELTGRDPAGIDPARGGVIDVPARFAPADLDAAARVGDPLLAEAADAGPDGQLTQYLAGVPDLLRHYKGTGGDPYGQAVITAAMDATRLGHASPLPAALLQEAAVGYLTGQQRTKDIASWRDKALTYATTELNGAVRALQPIPPPSGTGVVGYQAADYLDQHGRRTRQEQLGPASLWDALTARTTSASDLGRLAQAARDRGLYRHAAALWTTAATLGSTYAARDLVTHLCRVSPGDTARAAQWAAGQASLDDPGAVTALLRSLLSAGTRDAATALAARVAGHVGLDDAGAVAGLLRELREAGAGDAVAALLARDPADQASLDDAGAVAFLLRELREAGASDAVAALLARDPADQASPDYPRAVAELLRELREAGASDAVATLATRAAAHASLARPGHLAPLLRELREAGAGDAVTALATRAAAHVSLDDLRHVTMLLRSLLSAGAGDAVATLATRAAAHASLDDPMAVASLLRSLRKAGASDAVATLVTRAAGASAAVAARVVGRSSVGLADVHDAWAVAGLLRELRWAGASDAVAALLARDPAGQASLDDAWAVAELLQELREAGASDAVAALLARDPAAHARLDQPIAVAMLLWELREAGASDAVAALLARDPADQASLDDPQAVAVLLRVLGEAGASDAATALATRAADAGMFGLFLEVRPDEASSYRFGRQLDGTPSQSWRWQEPPSQPR